MRIKSAGGRLLVDFIRDIEKNPGDYSERERSDVLRVAADHLEHMLNEVEQLRREIDAQLKRKHR